MKEVSYTCDLLVLDEVHLFAADKFKLVFDRVSYKWIMGLTATINRMDGKETLLKKYAPVAVRVSQKKAIEKGWINDFLEINCPVNLKREEMEELDQISNQIRYFTSKFGDFGIMRNCINFENAKSFSRSYYPQDDVNDRAKLVQRDAAQGQRYISKRQEILYKCHAKVKATVDLIDEFKLKTITFSQSTEFADEVKNFVSRRSVVYHSNITSIDRRVEKTKSYATLAAAERFKVIKKGNIRKKDGKFEVYWKELKRIGVGTLKKEALLHFSSNKYKTDVICTAKALDQGFDVPDVELGIDGSRTSNPTQHTQRTGRIARNYTYRDGTKKQGIYINLYVPNSKDEAWLSACQKNSTNIVTVNDVAECKQLIKKVLGIKDSET